MSKISGIPVMFGGACIFLAGACVSTVRYLAERAEDRELERATQKAAIELEAANLALRNDAARKEATEAIARADAQEENRRREDEISNRIGFRDTD